MKTKRNPMMLELETLGTAPGSIILSIGDTFYHYLTVPEQEAAELTTSPATVDTGTFYKWDRA